MPTPSIDEQLEAALTLHREGRLEAAAKAYQNILEQDPEDIDTLHLLGAVTAQLGDSQKGLEFIDRAIALDSGCADFYNNRGLILAGLGRVEEAIVAHHRAIELNPDFAEAHNNLGNTLVRMGRLAEAEAAFRRTLALRPDYANAHSNLGVVLHRQEKFEEAIAAYRAALKLQPKHAEAYSNLGAALREVGEMEQAIAAYRAAIAIDANCMDAHANLGAALHDMGDFPQAIKSLERAIELNPRSNFPRYNLALTLLQSGDYERGLEEYENRAYAVASRRKFALPPWDGRQLGGRTIFIHAEGSFGDVIQYARFIPLVKARGGSVIFQVQQELVRLFATLEGAAVVIPKSQNPPPFEYQSPLISLARVFRVTARNIPGTPYLSADPAAAALWPARLGDDGRRKIGLTWMSSQMRHQADRRSIFLEQLAPLKEIGGARFFGIQPDQRDPAIAGMELWDSSEYLHDFADTAGLIANLDLVISVDTAVAHLAGAMGKKVFLLVSRFADWTWMRDGADTAWYPTMRIFRQPKAGDWKPVVAQVVEAVKAMG